MSPKRDLGLIEASLNQAITPLRSLATLGVGAGALLAFCPSSFASVESNSHVADAQFATPFPGENDNDVDVTAEVLPKAAEADAGRSTGPVSFLDWEFEEYSVPQRILETFDYKQVNDLVGDCEIQGEGQLLVPRHAMGPDRDDLVKCAVFTNKTQKSSFSIISNNENVFLQLPQVTAKSDGPTGNVFTTYHLKDWDTDVVRRFEDSDYGKKVRRTVPEAGVAKIMKYVENATLYKSLMPGSGICIPWTYWLSQNKTIELEVGHTDTSGRMSYGQVPFLKWDKSQKVKITWMSRPDLAVVSWKDVGGNKKCYAIHLNTMTEESEPSIKAAVLRMNLGEVVPAKTMPADLGQAGWAPPSSGHTVKERLESLNVGKLYTQMEKAAEPYDRLSPC